MAIVIPLLTGSLSYSASDDPVEAITPQLDSFTLEGGGSPHGTYSNWKKTEDYY